MINETTSTLEHVMEKLDAIEKKMLTEADQGAMQDIASRCWVASR